MTSERVLTTSDASEWRTILPIDVSLFGSVEYARIVEEHSEYQARLYVLDIIGGTIAYPFFLRPVRALPFAQQLESEGWDLLTPEYTGPRQIGGEFAASEIDFSTRFATFCQNHGILTEFAHLHPWQTNYQLLDTNFVSLDREIVYVDLSLSIERLWNESYVYACRKNINRAIREGVRIFHATEASHVTEFFHIYTHTMARNNAASRYLYPLEYFSAFFETMPANARFVLAEYRDQIVAGTLYLHDNQDVYSYLGGANQEFQQTRPTNAVVHHTIQWAHDAGKQRLILGGGYRPDDGIFRFKSSFSPFRSRFQVYRRIHLSAEYDRLCRAWSSYYHCDLSSNDYFPPYRSQPVAKSA